MAIKIFTICFLCGTLKIATFLVVKLKILMKNRSLPVSLIFIVLLFFACKTGYQPTAVQYKDYRVSPKQPINNELTNLLQPYADSVNKNMNDVVGSAAMELQKKQPEGTLGNVMADAMLEQAKEKFKTSVDASFLNYGGIRLSSIPAGNITRGKIFELSPFDNIIVLLKMDGNTLQQFLNIVASRGGWPCAGIQFQIKNKQAVNILIGNNPISGNNVYTIAMLDYVANGGDDCVMLKSIPQQNNGYLFRDAVLDYVAGKTKEGKAISSTIQNRVSNAE